ncbi:DUF2589 domain-containing protein [Luteibacter aegosomatis]|uniref:DUF2589 domain-containing protein n=1 Tax=Luteibacter aegosomatis TaxID=2911537 RepID=UPI001FF8C7AC|nr:DUF2589 domain-containing protein [Luteibacter aegosomatis]UPG85333.1 DUF2589 domain-containing protein [Luteibacter aegosomatis]
MASTSLNDLIEALAGAVTDAQDRIEQHQMAHLSDFFDEDNRPKSVVIRMPSIQHGADEGDEDLYRAPILPLVSTNVLRIKDVEIRFDADLGSLIDAGEPLPDEASGTPPDPSHGWRVKQRPSKPYVRVDTSLGAKDKAGAVHVVLRVEGSEPTDGAARLMNHLAQTQGVFKTFKPGD